MNLYFSPIERTELNLPTSNLSTSIPNIIRDTNDIQNLDFKIDKNNINNEEDIEFNQFYEEYTSEADTFENSDPQKKLNKVKLYFIVKSKIVEGREINYAVPIRSFDDLGNTISEKLNAFIASVFYVKVEDLVHGRKYIEGSPGSRPFRLEHMARPEPPFYAETEFPLKDFMLERKYEINGDKLELPEEFFYEKRIKVEFEDALGKKLRSFYYWIGANEYTEAMLDNTFLVNTAQYATDNRSTKSFNGEEKENGFFSRLKELELKDKDRFKYFNLANIFSVVSGEISSSIDKNIIPVFSNLEDAQDLLVTVLEEIHQPFQIRRQIESFDKPYYSKSLNYLDDSFSFQNNYFLPKPTGRIDRIKDIFKINKSPNLSKHDDNEFYNANKYQTKGPFFIEDIEPIDNDVYIPVSQRTRAARNNIWRETDYQSFLNRHFPGQPEAYSWGESRDMSDIDKGLLKKSQDMKIISIGLGDFLEFWNSPLKKNADLLFMPSLKDINKRQLPLFSKKPRDRFSAYQQKFRESKKQETQNYIYDIKISSK